jgi:formate-dependent nitrite reductase membrane component NrfD
VSDGQTATDGPVASRHGALGPLGGRRHRRGGGEELMVPAAEFSSYYGRPILKAPVWSARDIAGYFFLGGCAGASSLVAAAADLTGRPQMAKTAKLGSSTAIGLSLVALVHDLGRPARFANMLRSFKVTSPMSVGTWIVSAYVPASALATVSVLTGRFRLVGNAGTAAAAVLGPLVSTYTAALVANTAVPSWHGGYKFMPFVFASSSATAAAGLGLIGAPLEENAPARRLGIVAGLAEVVAARWMPASMGLPGEAYEVGKARRYGRISLAATLAGVATAALLGRRSRFAAALAGVAMLAGSAFERFTIFESGIISTKDPIYTVVPQRERLEARRDGARDG